MKKWIFNPITKDSKISVGLLFFRIGIGSMMLTHGIPKLMAISEKFYTFSDPLGIGSPLSYLGTVSGEFLSAIAIILGFATRVGSSILGFTMGVAALIVHAGDPFGSREKSLLFFTSCLLLFFTGPGKYSIDYVISKKRN